MFQAYIVGLLSRSSPAVLSDLILIRRQPIHRASEINGGAHLR
jgi:hypothetical protein